ncbi:MAG: Ig-like domain-containing protein [Burkholderiaceae bacterium]
MTIEFLGDFKMKKWLMMAAALAVSVTLGGCSAGGKEQPTVTTPGGGVTTVPTVTVALSSTTVTSGQPATVKATVVDASKKPVSGIVVTFSANSAVGLLNPTSALTDATGVATTTLSPASSTTTGADTVTASVTVDSTAYAGSTGYQLSATSAAISSFTAETGATALSAYGQTLLNLTMTGVSVTAPVSLSLTSNCVAAGKATISPSTVAATVNTVQFTYKDTGGCGSQLASDTVTVNVGGSATSSTANVVLTSPTANSVTFTSAIPAQIYLKGSGNAESSTVKFKVVDTAGNALPGQAVTLTLSSYAGGLLLDQKDEADLTGADVTRHDVQTSDSNGFVTAIVNSGTVPTPVRVIAKLASGVSTVSSALSVVTGLPSQLNFSLSQATFNIEGASHDGVANTYTIIASDRSGNPVADGTSVILWAEGGSIQGTTTTTTVNGTSVAHAQFVTAEPRPADGRVTVLAYAIGEESFVDTTGTNVYVPTPTNGPTNFQDLGDVVKSKLYDGHYDAVNDEVVSLSGSGASVSTNACVDNSNTYAQFALDRSIPNKPATCDAVWSSKTYVRRDVETVFSSSTPHALWRTNSPATGQGLDTNCTTMTIFTAPSAYTNPALKTKYYDINGHDTWYTAGIGSGTIDIIAADDNAIRLNPMPAGTTISAASLTDGLAVNVVAGSPVASTATAPTATFSYKFTTATAGIMTLTFTTPLGISHTYTFGINMLALDQAASPSNLNPPQHCAL